MGNQSYNMKYDVQGFIEIFGKIDGQIIELHQCSSDDFLGLNKDFKEYYRQSKIIARNASEIFESLNVSNSRELIASLENLYRNLKQAQLQFSSFLDASLQHLGTLDQHIDALFFPLKNLNQDLMSIKLLTANMRISSSAQGQVGDKEMDDMLLNLNAVINQFKNRSLKCESSLSGFKNLVKSIEEHFNVLRNRNVHDLDSILDHIHYGIILFAEKHEEASGKIPELKEQSDKTANSIADIITNLQYHDIIRQKIEHIHSTQKKLLDELIQNGNQEEASQNQSHQLALRIRDIAGLQSAQLLRANKEYQRAIEKITQRFQALSDDMALISTMCQQFSTANDNTEEYELQRLLAKLERSAEILSNYQKAGREFVESLGNLGEAIESFTSGIGQMEESIHQLKTKMVSAPTLQSSSDENLSGLFQQLQSLSGDIEKFEQTIQQRFTQIKAIGGSIGQITSQFNESIQKADSFSQNSETINHVILSLNKKNTGIIILLEENLKLSRTIAIDVRESLRNVRYYDFFDKVIVGIIGQLNQIHNKLSAESQAISPEARESLEGIRKSYTMASEHDIHNQVVDNQSAEIMHIPDEDSLTDEDEDEVEFF